MNGRDGMNGIDGMEFHNSINLPPGKFDLLVNGKPVGFKAERVTDIGIYREDGTRRDPDAMYNAWLGISGLKKGDVVTGRIKGAPMELDGGDERTINMVGKKDGITYGFGTVDFFGYEKAGGMLFETKAIESGFELVFNGDPSDYPHIPSGYKILFQIAWIEGEGEEEYNVVSFCTC